MDQSALFQKMTTKHGLLAPFSRWLFSFTFFRKRYYGIHKRIFLPFGFFKGQSIISKYDKTLKLRLDLDEWIQQHIYFLGIYDEKGINFLKKNLKKGDLFFDIGANIGCYSTVAAKLVGDEGEVHAFEPVSDIFKRLLVNIQLNSFNNVFVNRYAVHEKKDLLTLRLSSQKNLGMSSIFPHDSESGLTEKVEALSLDEYIKRKKIKKVALIKIDIEGAELFALRGMRETLLNLRPVLLIEIAQNVLENSIFSSEETFDFMKTFGYVAKVLSSDGEVIESMEDKLAEYTNFVFCPLPLEN